ncbi:MAG: cupin domain-containing protein [Chloroflexota bacterium]
MSEQQPPDVGTQLKILREQRGLSMRALAELCQISPNTISLIERGATSPNVSTLHQLATALDVPITAFFETPGDPLQVIRSRPGERPFSGNAAVRLESLGSGLAEQSLEPFLVTMLPAADSGPGAMSHEGHELVYCLSGVLEYVIEGVSYRLGAGESLLFEAGLPHCWRNPGSEPSLFLLILQTNRPGVSVEQHLGQ